MQEVIATKVESNEKQIIIYAELERKEHHCIHDSRHYHASLLIELGFAPLLISERFGHENVEITLNTYSHLYPNKHGEVAETLSKLIQN